MGPPDDKYDTVEFVAEGGMARVYRARRRSSGQVVAVREISGGPGSAERIASERRGAEIQRALCDIDARVPKVFEIFLSPAGWLYVEMEYIDGEDLAAVTQRGPLLAADAVRIAVEMFDFLRIAHSTPVSVDGEQRNQQVHGDLTPRNVRIATNGAVRILDFGIAKGLKATVTAASFANFGYVSPERARTGLMGVSDDFWSAGVVLYEMLSGRRAFPGTCEQISAALADRRNPPALDPHLPVSLRLIVAKLLAWDPAYRYPDAAAVLAELDAFSNGRPTRAEAEADAGRTRAVGRETRADPIDDVEPGYESRTTAMPARPQRSRRFLRAAPLAAAAIVLAHEGSVWQDAEARSRSAAADTGDVERLWSDYEALRDRAWLSPATSGLARVVAERLVSAASTTLKDYRQDEPRIRERHVEAARSQLARAVELQPDNVLAHAWLRYAQGHLARIAGDARRGDERRQAWARAVERFDEASRFAPDLLDPYLGLTRLYTHREYRDPDRARRAMSAAERLGHPRGIREHGQLGDLFKDEGDLLFRQARDVRGTGSEEPLLVRARAELVSALGEYEQSKGFGQTNTRIKEINDAIQRIDARLSAIRGDADQYGSVARWLEPARSLDSAESQSLEPAQGGSR
jgi:hypothetical protein